MNQPKLNFISRFTNSIINPGYYTNFTKQPAGKALGYFLLLTLVFGIFNLIRPVTSFHSGISILKNELQYSVPYFYFSDYKLSVDGEMPIELGDDNYKIIIDTNDNAYQRLDDLNQGMLITSDSIMVKDKANIQTIDYSYFTGLEFDKDGIINALSYLKWLDIIIIVFGLIGFMLAKLISVFLLSIIGLIINSSLKAKLNYDKILSLCFHALTLPLTAGVILDALGVNFVFFWVVYYLIGGAYLYAGIDGIRNEIQQPAENV